MSNPMSDVVSKTLQVCPGIHPTGINQLTQLFAGQPLNFWQLHIFIVLGNIKLNPCISWSFGWSDLMKTYYVRIYSVNCAWSLSDDFQGISSVPPADLLNWWEGWVGWAYLPSFTPKCTIYMAHAVECRVVKGPSNQMGTLPCILPRVCRQTLPKPWLLLRDSPCWTNVEKKQDYDGYHNHDNNSINNHQPTSKQSNNKLTWIFQ